MSGYVDVIQLQVQTLFPLKPRNGKEDSGVSGSNEYREKKCPKISLSEILKIERLVSKIAAKTKRK
jgi:hypothetical protein